MIQAFTRLREVLAATFSQNQPAPAKRRPRREPVDTVDEPGWYRLDPRGLHQHMDSVRMDRGWWNWKDDRR